MKVKKHRFTPAQKKLLEYLEVYPDNFLRPGRSRSGKLHYRMMNKNLYPVMVLRRSTVEKLLQFGLLYRIDDVIKLVKHGS